MRACLNTAATARRRFSLRLQHELACALPRAMLLALLCTAGAGMPKAGLAQGAQAADVASEERVKAASLYKFLNYIEWPPAAFQSADTPYVIGVVNADEIANDLEAVVAGRSVQNRAILVRRLRAVDPLGGVHMLFIGKAERARVGQLLQQVRAQPILVVTETEGASALGSMINFRLADDRVRFDVALEPAERAGLKLNSRLLAVALSVSRGTLQ